MPLLVSCARVSQWHCQAAETASAFGCWASGPGARRSKRALRALRCDMDRRFHLAYALLSLVWQQSR